MLINNTSKILDKIDFDYNLNFKKTEVFKDFCPSKIQESKLILLIDKLESLIPIKKKYLTIDIKKQILLEGMNTCKNTNWHVDGIDNQYLIYSIGSNLTEFCIGEVEIMEQTKLEQKNIEICNYLRINKLRTFKQDSMIPILYTSNDIHKGQCCSQNGNRLFIRLCYSDYITPKNKLLKR